MPSRPTTTSDESWSVLRKGEEVEYGFLGVYFCRRTRRVDRSHRRHPERPGPNRRITRTRCHHADQRAASSELRRSAAPHRLCSGRVEDQADRSRAAARRTTLRSRWRSTPTTGRTSLRFDPRPVFGLRVDYSSIHPIELIQLGGSRCRGSPPACASATLSPIRRPTSAFKTLGDDPKRWFITQVNGAQCLDPGRVLQGREGPEETQPHADRPDAIIPAANAS